MNLYKIFYVFGEIAIYENVECAYHCDKTLHKYIITCCTLWFAT